METSFYLLVALSDLFSTCLPGSWTFVRRSKSTEAFRTPSASQWRILHRARSIQNVLHLSPLSRREMVIIIDEVAARSQDDYADEVIDYRKTAARASSSVGV